MFGKKKSRKRKINNKRTKGGKVPQGRTLSTNDRYLGKGGKEVKGTKKYKDSIEEFMGA